MRDAGECVVELVLGDCHSDLSPTLRLHAQGLKALMFASKKGRVEVIPILLEACANKDLQDGVRRLGACARLPPRPVLTVVSPSPLSDRAAKRP